MKQTATITTESFSSSSSSSSSSSKLTNVIKLSEFLLEPPKESTLSEQCAFALIVLNQEIRQKYFQSLWKRAVFTVCADGGYLCLLDYLQRNDLASEEYKPDCIIGDFDSISSEIVCSAASKDIHIVREEDQNKNDFQKAVQLVETKRPELFSIIVIGSLGGRFDHTAASLSVLHEFNRAKRMWLIEESSAVCLIMPGISEIVTFQRVEGPSCGIVPFLGPTIVSTKGLCWNLDKQSLEFGHLISTSNQIAFSRSNHHQDQMFDGFAKVTIDTDKPVVWTVEI